MHDGWAPPDDTTYSNTFKSTAIHKALSRRCLFTSINRTAKEHGVRAVELREWIRDKETILSLALLEAWADDVQQKDPNGGRNKPPFPLKPTAWPEKSKSLSRSGRSSCSCLDPIAE